MLMDIDLKAYASFTTAERMTQLWQHVCECCQPVPNNISAFPGVRGTAGSVKVWEVQTNPVFP